MIATGLAQAAWQHAGALMELAPTPAPGGSGDQPAAPGAPPRVDDPPPPLG